MTESNRHPSQRRYPPELRERAIRMVFERIAEAGERQGAVTRVARQLGVGPESLRHWVHQAETDGGGRAVTTERASPDRRARARGPRAPPGERDPEGGVGFLRAGARPALAEMSPFIDEHCRSFGVEPICRTLAITPSSYYAAKRRPPSARTIGDEALSAEITRIHVEHFSVYGVRKAWRVLRWEGRAVGRDRVGRPLRALGLAGATRTKRVRTTKPTAVSQRPADLVERVFIAPAPNRLWVADLERHEALTNRAVMERAPPPTHRSGPVKLGATRTQGRG